MALIEFDQPMQSRSHVSLRKKGHLFINKEKIDEILKNARGVYLYIDDSKPVVAFKFSTDEYDSKRNVKNNFMKLTIEKSGVNFNLRSVLEHYKIKLKKCHRKLCFKLENGFFMLDLKQIKENSK